VSQAQETNSVVDIGLHYVALAATGQPLDSDGDGLPDYLEDASGNGSRDGSETDSLLADTDGDGIGDLIERMLGRNPLAAGESPDSSGAVNLRVFTPLK
jgi:hypothetical protein